MSKIKPTEISANRGTRELSVTWNDGHMSVYSFSLLRNTCPCAECRGGHENMGGLPDREVWSLPDEDRLESRLRNLEAVGSYGITFEWEDGHHFGIYNWDYLRALCPCQVCWS